MQVQLNRGHNQGKIWNKKALYISRLIKLIDPVPDPMQGNLEVSVDK